MGKVILVPTTDATLGYALRRSLIAGGAAKGPITTWGDFKRAGDALFRDDDPLGFVEYGIAHGGLGYVHRCEDDDPLGAGLREV